MPTALAAGDAERRVLHPVAPTASRIARREIMLWTANRDFEREFASEPSGIWHGCRYWGPERTPWLFLRSVPREARPSGGRDIRAPIHPAAVRSHHEPAGSTPTPPGATDPHIHQSLGQISNGGEASRFRAVTSARLPIAVGCRPEGRRGAVCGKRGRASADQIRRRPR